MSIVELREWLEGAKVQLHGDELAQGLPRAIYAVLGIMNYGRDVSPAFVF
jgi:hypothetical protein